MGVWRGYIVIPFCATEDTETGRKAKDVRRSLNLLKGGRKLLLSEDSQKRERLASALFNSRAALSMLV